MKLAERIAVSYSHVSDEFPEEFITSLHRSHRGPRVVVRHPNPDGEPYKVTGFKWVMNRYTEQELREDAYDSMLYDYTLQHWS